jgi:leucine dehydrogenase
MNWIRRETNFVTGAGQFGGGSGDPSPVTAWGVFHGIRACLEVVYGSPDVRGRTVAVQGVGNVGYNLARYLHERGAKVLVSDINMGHISRAVEEFGAEVLDGDTFYEANCDVLAPCAIGGIINERSIAKLRAPIVCGGANNILESEERDGQLLAERGITYGPDYVVNAGGLMNVNAELRGWPAGKAMEDAQGIYDTEARAAQGHDRGHHDDCGLQPTGS